MPLTAGGPTDLLARIIAQPLGERLKQPVVIDNRPGAGGNIGAEAVAKSPPDGYTLFMGTSGPMSINSSLYGNLAIDPMKDLVPIIGIASAPFIVCVNANVPAKTMAELMAYAKANPGKLNYGSVGVGSQPHLSFELLKLQTGMDVVHVPFKGTAQSAAAVLSGEI